VLGLADSLPVLLRRPDVWEVPHHGSVDVCAAGFGGALERARTRRKRGRSGSPPQVRPCGMALARPSVLPGAAMLLVPVLLAWRDSRRVNGSLLTAAVAPITAIGLALLAFDFARLATSPEFGQNYHSPQIRMRCGTLPAWILFVNLRAVFSNR